MNSVINIKKVNIDLSKESIFNTNPSRPTKAIINLKIYRENLLSIKRTINRKMMAIVKANAYGHGLSTIAKTAENIVDYFGVAVLEEAATLRSNGINKPILVLGYVDPNQFIYSVKNQIRIAIYSYEQWRDWKEQIEKYNLKENIKFHIKINSGMNRLGFKVKEELNKTINEMNETNGAKIEGVFTHFATADMPGDEMIDVQENTFIDMIDNLLDEGYLIHIANSAYTLSRKNANLFDMVRIGISSYGLLPDNNIEKDMCVKTKPIMQLKTKVVHIQELRNGDRVGYGGKYQAKGNERIGIIPIGYADGLLRRYASDSYVLINGGKRKFAGRICMDQSMILLREQDEIGDEVVIYGKQGNEEVTLEMAGDWSESINYELVCLLSERITREYIQ